MEDAAGQRQIEERLGDDSQRQAHAEGGEGTRPPAVRSRRGPDAVHRQRHRDEIVGEQQQHDLQRGDQRRLRQEEPNGEEDGYLHGLHDLVQGPRQHALVDAAADRDRRHEVDEPGVGEHHARRRPRDVDGALDGDAHLGLAQGGGVVHAIPGHPDRVPGVLQRPDHGVLAVGEHLGDHARRPGKAGIVPQGRPGDQCPADAHLLRHGTGGRRRVAGDHLDVDAQRTEGAHQPGGIGTGRIGEGHKPCQPEMSRRACRHGEHPASQGRQCLHVRRQGRGRLLAGRGHDSGHAFPDDEGLTLTLERGDRLFCGRVERLEGHPAPAARRAPRPQERQVDRVLGCPVRGERREAQQLSLPEGRVGARRFELQPILGERAGLVGTEDVHRRRLLHGRQPGDQHMALAAQLQCADCLGDAEGGGQRHGDRGDQQGEGEGHDPPQRCAGGGGVDAHRSDEHDVERHQGADDGEDDPLERRLRLRRLDKPGGPPEGRGCAGGLDAGGGLTSGHDGGSGDGTAPATRR